MCVCLCLCVYPQFLSHIQQSTTHILDTIIKRRKTGIDRIRKHAIKNDFIIMCIRKEKKETGL